MLEQLDEGLAAIKLELSTAQKQKLIEYLELLHKWNRVYNLTAIQDPQDMVTKHLIDSLAVAPYLTGAGPVLDVGTGAGLPGIPLAIYYPEIHFVLLDSNGKKTRFLQQVVATLALSNVTIVHARIEDYEQADGFNLIISRAFSSLNDMIAVTWRLLRAQGVLLAMKGQVPDSELAGLANSEVIKLAVPGQKSRHLVIVRK